MRSSWGSKNGKYLTHDFFLLHLECVRTIKLNDENHRKRFLRGISLASSLKEQKKTLAINIGVGERDRKKKLLFCCHLWDQREEASQKLFPLNMYYCFLSLSHREIWSFTLFKEARKNCVIYVLAKNEHVGGVSINCRLVCSRYEFERSFSSVIFFIILLNSC